ncbi:MAG: helix-turn-helix transcriptional regulator [Formivibrio sp.]|nr:helix-turn-helix transcriptional regulator [Formivibrio sp.]
MKRLIPTLSRLPRPLYCRNESLAVGSWTEVHHHSWCQFSYALSGVLGVRTPYGDHVAPSRYAVWIPPGVDHHVVSRHQTEMRSLYIEPEVAAALPATCTVLEVTPLMRELIRKVSALPVEYDENGAEGRLVAVLLDELAELHQAGFAVPLPQDRRLQAIYAGLQERPDDTRTLAQWAASAGASERTLARLFYKDTGMSFGQWRQRLRLVMSLDALEAGGSVGAIALGHGYESPSAFIAAFKTAFGRTPGELRPRDA